MKRLQNEIDKATFSSSSKRVKIIYSKYSINFASASSLNPRSLFNESPIKNLSFTERERKRESRNQNRIAEFHRGNKSPNLQDQSINRQIYLVYSQKKLWNRTWWWMWNSSCSFIVQITENHTVGSFRNSRQRDVKDVKGIARSGVVLSLSGVCDSYTSSQKKNLLALGFCGQGRWVSDD